jgi:hypothetical protein
MDGRSKHPSQSDNTSTSHCQVRFAARQSPIGTSDKVTNYPWRGLGMGDNTHRLPGEPIWRKGVRKFFY